MPHPLTGKYRKRFTYAIIFFLFWNVVTIGLGWNAIWTYAGQQYIDPVQFLLTTMIDGIPLWLFYLPAIIAIFYAIYIGQTKRKK